MRHGSQEVPEWVGHARRFVGTGDAAFLRKAIEACQDPSIRLVLQKPNVERGYIPTHALNTFVERMVAKGRMVEGAVISLIGSRATAVSFESAEMLEDEHIDAGFTLCSDFAARSRHYGFAECEALFARAMGTRAAKLGILGLAEATLTRASSIYRELTVAEPEAYTEALAHTLSNLGNALAEHRQFAAATGALYEAVGLFRDIALARGEGKREQLANALGNLGDALRRAGQCREARRAVKEAEGICRGLWRHDQRRYRSLLVSTLNNLGAVLDKNHEVKEAKEVLMEGVKVCRGCLDENTRFYQTTLAATLNNLGIALEKGIEFDEAVEAFAEAASVYKKLAEDETQVYLPRLAAALGNLGDALRKARHFQRARNTLTQAASIFGALAEEEQRFSADYALTLVNLGVVLRDEMRFPEARSTQERAIHIYDELSSECMEAYGIDLAVALNNYSNTLSDAKDWGDARAACKKAVAICRKRVAADARRHKPYLASCLINYCSSLRDGDKPEPDEARKAGEEAEAIYRELAEEQPRTYRPDLALVLHNRATHEIENGHPGRASALLDQVEKTYTELASSTPRVYLPSLAGVLSDKGTACEAMGRGAEALAAFEGAVAAAESAAGEPHAAWLAKGKAHKSYGWLALHHAERRETDRAFRMLAAAREAAVYGTGSASDHSLVAAVGALRKLEAEVGNGIAVVTADALPDDSVAVGLLRSREPYLRLQRSDCLSRHWLQVMPHLLFRNGNSSDKGHHDEAQGMAQLGRQAWLSLPGFVRDALDPSKADDILVSACPRWTAFPWEALRYGDGDSEWLGLAQPLARLAGITGHAFGRLGRRTCGGGQRGAAVLCPWDALPSVPLEGARREGLAVAAKLSGMGYSLRPNGGPIVGKDATLSEVEDILRSPPAIVHFAGHGDMVGGEGALVMWGDPPANSRAYLGRTELAKLRRSEALQDDQATKDMLVVLSACFGGRTRVFGGQRQDVISGLVGVGAATVIASPLPIADWAGQALGEWLYEPCPFGGRGIGWTLVKLRAWMERLLSARFPANWAMWTLLVLHGNPYLRLPHVAPDTSSDYAPLARDDEQSVARMLANCLDASVPGTRQFIEKTQDRLSLKHRS